MTFSPQNDKGLTKDFIIFSLSLLFMVFTLYQLLGILTWVSRTLSVSMMLPESSQNHCFQSDTTASSASRHISFNRRNRPLFQGWAILTSLKFSGAFLGIQILPYALWVVKSNKQIKQRINYLVSLPMSARLCIFSAQWFFFLLF